MKNDSEKSIIQQIIDFNEDLNNKTLTIIDVNRLKSIVSSYYYYESIEHQLLSIVKSIIKNHAFIDANKRTGLMTLVFYSNKYNLTIKLNDTEMFDFIQKIAASDTSIEDLSSEVF